MRRRLFRLLVATLTLSSALLATTSSPALANGPSSVIFDTAGTGTISPGLDVLPQAQTFSFTARAAVGGLLHGQPLVPSPGTGVLLLDGYGDDMLGTWAAGEGSITIHPSSFDTLLGAYVRVGFVAHIVAVNIGGPGGWTALSATCELLGLTSLLPQIPPQVPDGKSFELDCAGSLNSTT